MAQSSPQEPPASRRAGREAQRENGMKSREAILDAAEALFAERGYAGTGISAISKASGLPASSIYWFFANKDELLGAAVERAMSRWVETLGASLAGTTDGQLTRMLSLGLETFQARLPLFMRMQIMLALERGDADPELLDQLRHGRERGRSLMTHALAAEFRHLGEHAEPLAEDLSSLAMCFASGTLLGDQLDPGKVDLERFTEELGVAMRAIAEHRLEGESPG